MLCLYISQNECQPPTKMPTPPLVPGCPSEFMRSGLYGKEYNYNNFTSSSTNYIQFSICSTIRGSCGEAGQMCYENPTECTGACQGWTEADGPAGASLGKYMGFTRLPNSTVRLIYMGGDVVMPGNIGRALYMDIREVASGPPIVPVNFVIPSGHVSGQPYIFRLYINANVQGCAGNTRCDTCTESNCVWCLQNSKCQNNVDSCEDYILNEAYCPNSCSLSNNCMNCTANPTVRQCAWCLGQNTCLRNSSVCINGVVKDRKYCPI